MNVFDDYKQKLYKMFSLKTGNQKSSKWKEYHLGETNTHCIVCYKRNNKVYSKSEIPKLPEHFKCACYLDWLRKLTIGSATWKGTDGVDYYLSKHGVLPSYYITKEEAYGLGWNPVDGNLGEVAPSKIIGGDIFYNRENKLPNADGRIWYECDVSYDGNFRNGCRIVFSNDGLMFMTEDHYVSFIVIE